MTYEEKLYDLAAANRKIVVMTAENRAAIRSLPQRLGDRFIDVGIAEQTLVGAAAGLALRGRIPVVHALSAFLTMRAFEFIRTDVGIANLPVKLVGFIPGLLSEANGPTHQAVEDVALMRGIPNMKVFCPADADQLVEALPQIIADPSPWYIRYTSMPPVVRHYDAFTIGKAEVLVDGMDVAILTYGLLTREAWRAKELLEARGRSVRFISFPTLKPIDAHEIVAAARECPLIVVVEDHFKTGGLYWIVADVFLDNTIMIKVLPISLGEHWFRPALLRDVLAYEGLTAEHIASRIEAALGADRHDTSPVDDGMPSSPYLSRIHAGE